jgi:hypothetical protein
MSTVLLADVKAWLRVIHSGDDGLIQRLIDQAEDESLRFLGRTQAPTLPLDYPSDSSSEDVPSSEDPAAMSYEKAVCILVQAAYEQPDPDKAARMRQNAEVVLMPYRRGLGV